MLHRPITRALILAGVCLLAISPFFWWGSPSGHDFEFHVFSWMEVLGQWRQGILYPRWAGLAHFGYGEARFLFYPPFSWTLGAAIGALLPWGTVPGAYCWLAIMLAGVAMYRLAREWLQPADALFAAAFYAVNPYHLVIIYWRSAYAELLAAALLPLVLLCLLRLQEPAAQEPAGSDPLPPTFRPTLYLSMVLAAAWLTNAPAAVMIHYSTAGLALLMAAREAFRNGIGEQSRRARVTRPLVRTAIAILLGAGLAAFYLVPAIYEQRWVDISQVMAPGVRPQDNFLFTRTGDPDHNRFNFLISTVALAEVALLALVLWFSRPSKTNRREREREDTQGNIAALSPWRLLATWGAVTALLLCSVSQFFWQHLPKFRFVQLPFRWLLCMNAALAVLLTMASKRWTVRILAYAVLLATVVIAGFRIQPPWWDTSDDLQEMSDAVRDGTGYEGTDEYVPTGADAYDLKKDLPRVSDEAGATLATRMLAWGPTEKHFVVHSAAAQDLTLRLFSYPAWQVVVNGHPVPTEKTESTRLIVVPVAAGDNDIHIYFRRTKDRLVGKSVALLSVIFFVVLWMNPVSLRRLLLATRMVSAHPEARVQDSASDAESHVA